MDERRRGSRGWGGLLALVGLCMAAEGAWLVALGGTFYYLLAGLAMALSGALLFVHRAGAGWIYLALVAGTLGWAFSEAGFHFWLLIPRLDVVLALGLPFLIPGAMRPRPPRSGHPAEPQTPRDAWLRPGGTAAAAAAAAVAVVLLGALTAMRASPGAVQPTMSSAGAAASGPSAQAEAQAAAPAAGQAADMATADRRGAPAAAGADWAHYGGTLAGDRYSSLRQITPDNVKDLRVAWVFHTGERRQPGDPPEYTFEDTPLKVNGTVYLCTPHNVIVALDPDTGTLRWRYDPHIGSVEGYTHLSCRGVAYYQAPQAAKGTACARRILEGTADARLIAVDADSGRPCRDFGRDGEVDLKRNMGRVRPGYYYPSSAPLIVHGLAIVGGWVADDQSTDEPSGVVRAYDAVTGALKWNFDAGNPDETTPLPAGHIYTRNSVNDWAPPSADPALGLVYLPMGIQTPDTWGGQRTPQSEKFGSSITAVDADTGKLRWVYQTVHHDLWDMDIGAQPSLFDMPTPQGTVPALVAVTKRGDLFVLDRRDGHPLIPAPERPVPQGAAAGDHVSPTQPFSALSFAPQRRLTGADMWGVTPFDQMWCRAQFHRMRYDGIFTPPSTQGSLVYPGNYGVFDWGGIAVDPVQQRFFVTPTYVAFQSRLTPRNHSSSADVATARGNSPATAAAGVSAPPGGHSGVNPQRGTPFAVRLQPFLSPLDIPCQSPPWGYVAAVDPSRRAVLWEHKNGTTRDEMPLHLPVALPLGVPGLGGPIVTASGLGFYSGTLDDYLRAYDLATGRQLWSGRLPAGGQATPMTYRSDKSGRQFVVVAAGGHSGLGTRSGDAVVAFALPQR